MHIVLILLVVIGIVLVAAENQLLRRYQDMHLVADVN